MYYRKFVKNILISALVPFLSLIAAIIIIDPLQVFHKSWIHPGKYCKNFRESLYGIVKYEDFDSVIIGSSMATNFSANEASQKLPGGKFINIALKGFTSQKEKQILLKHLFETKTIKNVIYSYDGYIEGNFINNYDRLFGSYVSKLLFYFNDNLSFFLQSSMKHEEYCISNLDHPDSWHNIPEHKSRFGGFNKWIDASKWHLQAQASLAFIIKAMELDFDDKNEKKYSEKEIQDLLNKNLFYFVRKHRDTHFLVFLPPGSKIYWKAISLLDGRALKEYLMIVKYLVSMADYYSNLTIYGFDNELFTEDVKRYKDLGHYDEKVNSFMLEAMRNGTHILTPQNVDAYLEKFEKSVIDFDIKSLYEQIKKSGIVLK